MTVKIVTDSSCDLPDDLVAELGIEVLQRAQNCDEVRSRRSTSSSLPTVSYTHLTLPTN